MSQKLLLAASILLFSCSILHAEESADNETAFQLTDLFRYVQPVKKAENEKKWFLNISGGYVGKEGNTDSVNTTYGGSVKYDNYLIELMLAFSGSYGKLNDIVVENSGTSTLNFDYFLFWRFKSFFYTMSDYNKITLLEHRNGTGAGVKIYFVRNNYLLIDLSGAPLFQYEKYEEQDAEKKWAWSIRGRAEIFPYDDDFTLKYSVFYIPLMENHHIYRTIHDIYFYKKLSGALGFKTGYRREYNTYDKKSFEENPLLKKTDSTVYIQAALSL
jgi:hypothetical protein